MVVYNGQLECRDVCTRALQWTKPFAHDTGMVSSLRGDRHWFKSDGKVFLDERQIATKMKTAIKHAGFSRDASLCLVSFRGMGFSVWDTSSDTRLAVASWPHTHAKITADGKCVVAYNQAQKIVALWRLADGLDVDRPHRVFGMPDLFQTRCAVASYDGSVICFGSSAGNIFVARAGVLTANADTDYEPLHMFLTSDGSLLFVHGRAVEYDDDYDRNEPRTLCVYETATMQPIDEHEIKPHGRFTASDDGETVMLSQRDGKFTILRGFDGFRDQTIALCGHNAFREFFRKDGDGAIWSRVAAFRRPYDVS